MYLTKSSTFLPGFVFPRLYTESIIELFELEGTFKGHLVQLLAINRDAHSSIRCSQLCPAWLSPRMTVNDDRHSQENLDF